MTAEDKQRRMYSRVNSNDGGYECKRQTVSSLFELTKSVPVNLERLRETNQIVERFPIICIPLEILFVDETFDSLLDHW